MILEVAKTLKFVQISYDLYERCPGSCKNSTISSENELETNTLACSWNESESDSSGTSESSNSESNLEEYEINATKKK